MPPMAFNIRRTMTENFSGSEFLAQWKSPSDIFSVLLILGGDIVGCALAQLAGSRINPVAFSFGWVAFAVTAVVAVINGQTGYVRDNQSWIIGRIVRDFEHWMDKQPRVHAQANLTPDSRQRTVEKRIQEMTETKWKALKERAKANRRPDPERPRKAGLCVSIYRAQEATKNCPGYDTPYITGILTTIVQLGVAAIPYGLYGDWAIFLVTAAGILLSFSSGALSQWSKEKWACRNNTKKTFVLTSGNGSQHAIVIQGNGVGLDLEDLSSNDPGISASFKTIWAIITLGAGWVILLVTAAGIHVNTWFLLAVGGIGILQNMFAAGASRAPKAFGVPLEFVEVIGEWKVMDALFKVEESYPCLGKCLLPIFFPGKLNEHEQARWKRFDEIAMLKKDIEEESEEETEGEENRVVE